MLSGFQEAAQKIENKDENALVPFYQFYDTVHTFLESAIRRVIDRCQNAADANDGLEQQDVNVLKLLYLVRYIEDVKANIENIAILMIDDIHTDKDCPPRIHHGFSGTPSVSELHLPQWRYLCLPDR